MIKNKIAIVPLTRIGETLKQHLNRMSLLRVFFLYLPAFWGGLKYKEHIILILVVLLALEAIVYYFFYRKICVESKARYFLYLVYISFTPLTLFVASVFCLLYSSELVFYFLLFLSIYIYVELRVFFIYKKKLNWNRVIKIAQRKNVFLISQSFPGLIEFNNYWVEAKEMGYKKTWLDKFMDYWVLGLAFIVAPIAQLTVFTTPFRDYEIASFSLAIILMVLCVALNKHLLSIYVSLKLIRMKERGEF